MSEPETAPQFIDFTLVNTTWIEGQELACPVCGTTCPMRLTGRVGMDSPQRHCPNGHSTPVPALAGWDLKTMLDATLAQVVTGDGSTANPYMTLGSDVTVQLVNRDAIRTGEVRL